jgi:hypothetical protein
MNLVEQFVGFAERRYAMDWAATQRAVVARLNLDPGFEISAYGPWKFPSYWCAPILVGDYVGASTDAVLNDTEVFVAGCVMRHLLFGPGEIVDALHGVDEFRSITDAYDRCRLDRATGSSFDARFSTKCLPWVLLLALGTRSVLKQTEQGADYESAMKAIIRVYSCLQMIDDWHDKEEDVARSHWNMWVHEPAADCLAVMSPLLSGSHGSVGRLRPHLLRTALTAQLRDTARELMEVTTVLGYIRPAEQGLPHRPPNRGIPQDAGCLARRRGREMA